MPIRTLKRPRDFEQESSGALSTRGLLGLTAIIRSPDEPVRTVAYVSRLSRDV